jgi:EAL domain-containing protein (putative c-di-GMP-specific phosphodiesterase class I)
MDHLAALGCRTGQGFFIADPQPAADLTAMLTNAFGVGPVFAADPVTRPA